MLALPRYSLLVPCYNAEAYISDFLLAVTKLNKAFDEVIFYDDASTDDTFKILTEKGCTVIKGVINKGPGYSRNRLVEKAICDYIHFHDIDDDFNPDFLDLVDKQLGKGPAELIFGNADWIDSSTRKTIINWRYNEFELMADPLAYFITNPLGIINTVYKRAAYLAVGGFNEIIRCWEDADLHIRLAASGVKCAFIDRVIAYSLRHNNGLSSNQQWCWGCRVKFLENYTKTLDKRYEKMIGAEFEKAAYNLFSHKQYRKAIKSFHNSRSRGHDAPAINNGILKKIKIYSPLIAFLLKALAVNFKTNHV